MEKGYLKASLAAAAASIILVSFLFMIGAKGRVFSLEGVVVSRSPLGAYKALKERGGRGRVFVCITRHTHSTPLDDMKLIGYRTFPVTPMPLSYRYEKLLSSENLFWVLMQEGFVRKIIYAIPEEEWGRVASKVTRGTTPPPLDMNFRGSPISIYTLDTLPVMEERVILFIDGSVSSTMEPELLLKFIKGKGIDFDLALLTVNTTGGQERAMQLATSLRAFKD